MSCYITAGRRATGRDAPQATQHHFSFFLSHIQISALVKKNLKKRGIFPTKTNLKKLSAAPNAQRKKKKKFWFMKCYVVRIFSKSLCSEKIFLSPSYLVKISITHMKWKNFLSPSSVPHFGDLSFFQKMWTQIKWQKKSLNVCFEGKKCMPKGEKDDRSHLIQVNLT